MTHTLITIYSFKVAATVRLTSLFKAFDLILFGDIKPTAVFLIGVLRLYPILLILLFVAFNWSFSLMVKLVLNIKQLFS